MKQLAGYFDLNDEQGVLRVSIAATILVALAGIVAGLVSGSFAILFDGVYSLVDASMGLLALVVVGLINSYARSEALPRRLRERFTMGFWHLEPMVLAANGMLLIGVALYAFVTAIGSILSGGRELQLDLAIGYAVLTLAVCVAMALIELRANRRIGSEFLRLDARSWMMSGAITAALLIAFVIAAILAGTRHAWLAAYADPGVLAIVCLVIIPLPISSIRQALSDMLLVTPVSLKQQVDSVCMEYVERCGFVTYRAYVAKVGRGQDIEIYFIVPPGMEPRSVADWDALRDEIADAIGEDTHDRWLTIVFTEDLEWA